MIQASDIPGTLSHAYIIGGSPCSGKSTLAGLLSARFGLYYYKVDDHQDEHLQRCRPDRQPTMHRLSTMSWNEIWLRPVDLQVEELFQFYRERFELILDDLRTLDQAAPTILEGAAFLPELLHRYRVARHRATFLVPTQEFQRGHYEQRPWIQSILAECDDPDLAFQSWMMRDHLFGQEIARQALAFGYPVVVVDGSETSRGLFDRAVAHFGLSRCP
jgi:2-phosphoglycerate kinase